jgi:uncharacterized cupin superfamily protein
MARPNVFDGEFPMVRADSGISGKQFAREAGAKELGGTVYELAPGSKGMNLHAHYGNEEMFVVLEGTPTLRTHDSEEGLRRGDVVVCVRGREGMHTFENRSSERVLLLALSTANSPDVVIYPESETVGVATRSPFAAVPPGGDEGVVGLFRAADNQRKPPPGS